MGPRPFGRGRPSPRHSPRHNPSASMGPRPFGRGRESTGRTLTTCIRASMGPRPFGRGRRRNIQYFFQLIHASMGPRPFGRGRPRRPRAGSPASACFNGAATFRSRKESAGRISGGREAMLQWGRDLSVAEGVISTMRLCTATLLQWGRDLSVAEGVYVEGAQAAEGLLQWGRDLSVAEGAGIAASGPRSARASMGPRPFGRGRRLRRSPSYHVQRRFNGAATFRSRKEAPECIMTDEASGFNGAATFRSRKDWRG